MNLLVVNQAPGINSLNEYLEIGLFSQKSL